MSEPRHEFGSLHFGPFELSTESSELRKHGQRLKLSGQAIEVLLMLASNAGRLVTREDLQRKLWPGDSFGDFEHGLNAAVNRLRETLGDSATDPTYIETVPRRGYRFIAPVDRVPNSTDPTALDNVAESRNQPTPDVHRDEDHLKMDSDSSSTHIASALTSASSAASVSSTQARPSSGAVLLNEAKRHKGVLALMLVVLAALIVGLGVYLSRLNERRNEWGLQAMKISRVTQTGTAVNVAISPDGHYVAFALREGEKQSLNVRQVATGSEVQILPPDEIVIWDLTFSPDANYIDFVRSEKNNPYNTYLYRIPVLGGTPHLVMQGGIDGSNSYSPDGTQFAFLRVQGTSEIDVLIANADGTKERVLATRPYLDLFSGTAWSPDGKTIAFTTWEVKEKIRGVLWAISISDGSVREIYSTQGFVGRPRWLPDGSGLLASVGNVNQALGGQLWFISFPQGRARRLTNDLMEYQDCCLDLTRNGSTLVDTELTRTSDLWVAPVGDTARTRQITPRGPAVGRFSWMPDGRVVFSERDGRLIAVNLDGTGRTQLNTNNDESWDPSVCGDGQYIVYSAYNEQKLGIWRMGVDGSNPIRIADETIATAPQCSPDGKWVIYIQGISSLPMRVAIGGDKPPEPISQSPAIGLLAVVAISPDGMRIAYLAGPGSSIVNSLPSGSQPNRLIVVAFDSGTVSYQFDWPGASAGEPRWAPEGEALDYVLTRNGVSNIWRQKLDGATPKQITNFKSGQIFDFDWSHDGRQLALTRGTESSDVVLISNFR